MTVKEEIEDPLWEYVAKFNMVALETPGVDAKIKIHAFIERLRSAPFFNSMVMNKPLDFGDILGMIDHTIHPLVRS